jgi:DMSO/TMAO reductase YedYZ heme-binding membrane subunit
MTPIDPNPSQEPAGRWRLFWLLVATVAVVAGLVVLCGHGSVQAVRQVVRLTAQISLVLFCAAFGASAIAHQWPGAWSSSLRDHRRQLGLAFAFSHGVHAIGLAAFARLAPVQFHQAADPAMFVFGGLAYGFIIAMAATSFDRAAVLIGPHAWRWLHLIGAYDIWLTFLVAEGKRAAHSAHYWPYVALLVVVMALRWIAMARRVRPTGSSRLTA